MTPGSLSINTEAGRSSNAGLDGYVFAAAAGVLAGILIACARMPLHLPGHKALFWIPPIVLARLMTRRRFGASVGAIATIATALPLGGRLAGGGGAATAATCVLLAGLLLDGGAALSWCSGLWRSLLVLAFAGAMANFICFSNRLLVLKIGSLGPAPLADVRWAAGCHLAFGFVAGAVSALLAGTAGWSHPRTRRGRDAALSADGNGATISRFTTTGRRLSRPVPTPAACTWTT